MSKKDFLEQLRKRLSGLPQEDVEERLVFYSEMIDDRMEEGLTEEEAVAAAGNIDDIVAGIVADIPLTKLAKERIKPKREMRAWEIVLLVLGSPLWISLLIVVFVLVLSVYIVLWAGVIVLWAVFIALGAGSVCGIVSSVGLVICGNATQGLVILGAGFVCLGLAIYMFFGCIATVRCVARLTGKMALWIKNCFIKKEAA